MEGIQYPSSEERSHLGKATTGDAGRRLGHLNSFLKNMYCRWGILIYRSTEEHVQVGIHVRVLL